MKPTPSLFIRLIIGVLLIALTAELYLSVKDIHPHDTKVINSAIICFIAYLTTAVSITTLRAFPGKQTWLNILPAVGIAYSSVFAVSGVLFITFSNSFVIANGLITAVFFLADFYISRRRAPRMAYIPLGRATHAAEIPNVEWQRLDQPTLPENRLRAIVADLHSNDLSPDWQRFLADCTLRGIAVYNIRQIEESLTGRVKIRHMYENDLGSLLPSPRYMLVKRVLDIFLIIISAPLTVPLMIATAIAIRSESAGSIFFVQNRVGQGGHEFKIYKFRSMTLDSEKDGAKLAQVGDARITRVGKFIRKTRLDELPQFWNILRGDMSLIGPRPEQKVFVEQFNERIPFYNYRHIVKPGLSGWAQVTQGYAGNEDETQIKLEHDFYYVKHFSLSLDILIIFKTIKTILTGFGAR
ncbi:exopolysaccharide biosynthesis polyprenyl glycosylphosphotransferase [Kingella negevensis]|uniref:exopolysaccharide biosynthesis polyprenyl glycosylphosphotransferase n=1 Tax=Kingella negevensis TaxID=1522312 RepID=UPI00254A0778|nr:exopolysaccharide biosynthesis polyprenyl glycosylphosphotransferase [Kingella negevensis]MDK4683856.1 exopolysaccharide biosynthesis polyprenyl glycosylphosphotransferase [Kingella negevensis]MDK4707034.1 exopolysaccharide biosynthesis polyprenyl glycosylphosphotransferase [Kingella negevensis]MDK4710614.1 exopolysaccharide biosynthesis polyprenyl glycosylphosphotransferase [Kingella negevensis]